MNAQQQPPYCTGDFIAKPAPALDRQSRLHKIRKDKQQQADTKNSL